MNWKNTASKKTTSKDLYFLFAPSPSSNLDLAWNFKQEWCNSSKKKVKIKIQVTLGQIYCPNLIFNFFWLEKTLSLSKFCADSESVIDFAIRAQYKKLLHFPSLHFCFFYGKKWCIPFAGVKPPWKKVNPLCHICNFSSCIWFAYFRKYIWQISKTGQKTVIFAPKITFCENNQSI